MQVLKKTVAIVILGIIAFSSAYGQGAFAPYYPNYPSVKLSLDGAAPIYSGIPTCTEPVLFVLVDDLGAYLMVDSLRVSHDTLYVRQGSGSDLIAVPYAADPSVAAPRAVAPWYGGYSVTFDTWDTYTVMLRDTINRTQLKKIGTILIYPAFSTKPSHPLASLATQIKVTLGQSHTVCNSTYTNLQVLIANRVITLSYTEVPFTGACTMQYLATPQPYGPSYNLGILDTGSYTIKIDTMTLGTIRVENGFGIAGSAKIMKDPMTKSMAQPVSAALIKGIVYEPCEWNLSTQPAFDTVKTTTSADGEFSLLLPRSGYQYTIEAEKLGYYPQSIALNTSEDAGICNFELIPRTGMNTVGILNVTVKRNNAVLESVTVSLQSGRQFSACPMYLMKQAAVESRSGYTNAAGKVTFTEVDLVPFIDYAYAASYFKNNQSYSAYGTVRLNAVRPTELLIDFGATDVRVVQRQVSKQVEMQIIDRTLRLQHMSRFDNPNTIFSLYDVRGRSIFNTLLRHDGVVCLKHIPAGRYIAHINQGAGELARSIMLQ